MQTIYFLVMIFVSDAGHLQVRLPFDGNKQPFTLETCVAEGAKLGATLKASPLLRANVKEFSLKCVANEKLEMT